MSAAPLTIRARNARAWLMELAFPFWAEKGFDAATGLFHEKIDAEGKAQPGPRRMRVQARQIYCFALAGRMGWSGPWRELVQAGIETLSTRGRAEGGAVGHLLDVRGRMPDARRDLYDQAFAMFACAHAAPVVPDAIKRATEIADFIDREWKAPAGGYIEGEVEPALPRRQNPHMHMLEAAMALYHATAAPRWRSLAQSMYGLFSAHFYDAEKGILREFFDADLKPAPGDKGLILEPGHHFEWAWLAARYSEISGEDARSISRRLYEYGEQRGINMFGIAIDETWETGGVRAGTARLWPQTERLKAALALMEKGDGDAGAAVRAYDGLARYLDQPAPGMWRDRMREDGVFIEEPAPASSFYHIALALDELIRVADV